METSSALTKYKVRVGTISFQDIDVISDSFMSAREEAMSQVDKEKGPNTYITSARIMEYQVNPDKPPKEFPERFKDAEMFVTHRPGYKFRFDLTVLANMLFFLEEDCTEFCREFNKKSNPISGIATGMLPENMRGIYMAALDLSNTMNFYISNLDTVKNYYIESGVFTGDLDEFN